MALELLRSTFPAVAASAIRDRDVLGFPVGSGGLERQVIPLATNAVEPVGIAIATANHAAATPPFSAGVGVADRGNVVKVKAGASLGVGADINIATAYAASIIFGPVAAASGIDVWRVGYAVTPAAAGEVFGLYVDPRKLSGTVR